MASKLINHMLQILCEYSHDKKRIICFYILLEILKLIKLSNMRIILHHWAHLLRHFFEVIDQHSFGLAISYFLATLETFSYIIVGKRPPLYIYNQSTSHYKSHLPVARMYYKFSTFSFLPTALSSS